MGIGNPSKRRKAHRAARQYDPAMRRERVEVSRDMNSPQILQTAEMGHLGFWGRLREMWYNLFNR